MEKGKKEAYNSYGFMLNKGYGVPQNDAEAVRYYTIGVEKGDKYAMYNLGCCYEYGNGVKQDYKEAARYYQMAIDNGEDAKESLERCQSKSKSQCCNIF